MALNIIKMQTDLDITKNIFKIFGDDLSIWYQSNQTQQ